MLTYISVVESKYESTMWFNKGWICSVHCQIVLPVTTFNRLVFILFLSTAPFQIKSEESHSMPVPVSGSSQSLMSTSTDHSPSVQPHSPVQSQVDDHTDSHTKTDIRHDDEHNTLDEIKVSRFRNKTYQCIHLWIYKWVRIMYSLQQQSCNCIVST